MIRRVDYEQVPNMRLEIGCGDEKHRAPGHVGMDIADYGQEIVWDLTEGIPLPDNSVVGVRASHVLEHIDRQHLLIVMNELWRVIKPGGTLDAVVPHMENPKAWILPHYTRWNEAMVTFMTGELSEDYVPGQVNHSTGTDEIKLWKIVEMVKNDRLNLHFTLTPQKV